MDQKSAKAEEFFFVVDESNNPIPPLPRRLIHGHGVWHRVAHIWLVNNRHEILCQQRSLEKENNPGFWEPFFGGHLAPGEEYEAGAKRELEEELGIGQDLDLRPFKVFKYEHPANYNNEFQAIFVASWSGEEKEVMFQDGEVARVEWKTIDEVREKLARPKANGWTFCGYEPTCLDFIEQVYNHKQEQLTVID